MARTGAARPGAASLGKRKAPKARRISVGMVKAAQQVNAARLAAGVMPELQVGIPTALSERCREFCRNAAIASGQRVTHRVGIGLLLQAGLEALGEDMRKAAKGMMR